MKKILVVEDDHSVSAVIRAALLDDGFAVTNCETIAERDRLLGSKQHDVMLTDIMLGDGDGLVDLPDLRTDYPDMPIIILSAQNTLDTAIRATDSGAFEYFPKPFDIDALLRAVHQAVDVRVPTEAPADMSGGELPLVGRSAAMQDVYRMITRVLRNDLTVLVLGESGTGKELVADAIHHRGHRSGGPFVAVNTAAIPAELIESELFGHERGAFTGAVKQSIGKFEQANGGTLFLDEIGDMPVEAQTRLLRTLQSGTIRRVGGQSDIAIDVRIIAATNRDLQPLIAAGQFREDLYYRLNVVPISLPPLRDRAEDIPALCEHFLRMATREGLDRCSIEPDAVKKLATRSWPGNVRELRNTMYRLILMTRDNRIDQALVAEICKVARDEPAGSGEGGWDDAFASWLRSNDFHDGSIYHAALAAFERPMFHWALAETGGNQLKAAAKLGLNRNTLRKRLQNLSIDPRRFGGADS